jgi:hypothetical protein
MGLSDITGVFSRYFIVGFFLPAYVSLLVLWLAVSSSLKPDSLQRHAEGTQLLILGGAGLLVGLALSGLSTPITRVFEGYPLSRVARLRGLSFLPRAAISMQHRSYERLRTIRDDEGQPGRERARAAWRFDQFFPHDENSLLPTRLGNAMRAFERHSNVRWGLDGVTVWPRIEALLNAEERGLHIDAKIDLYVFLNAALGAFAVGVTLVVDEAINAPHSPSRWPLYAIPFVVSYILYRAAIGAAVHWGDAVRSSIDLHRLELYEKLGVRAPTSFSDELLLAPRVNKALLYGKPLLGDDLWREEESTN